MNLIIVGFGGALGSIARYQLGKMISGRQKSTFPIGTFIINITGAILLGVLSGFDANNNLYLLLGDGFLGAYTTFSTFMYEGFNLFKDNEKLNAIVYISSSFIFGLIGYALGYFLVCLIK